MSISIAAIDVGFGNTKYASFRPDGKPEMGHFASQVFFKTVEASASVLSGKTKTVSVPIDGLFYVVGPDVELAADRFRARHLHDGYTQSAEYKALVLGALHVMNLRELDLLVLGLPVAHFMTKRGALEKAFTGSFEMGRKKSITIRKVMVVAQPQGALFSFAATTGKLSEVMSDKCLVMDVGARTFDWLVTHGLRVLPDLSSSVNRGVSDIHRMIGQAITDDIGEPYEDYEMIDQAMRAGKPLKIYKKSYDLKVYEVLVQKVAEQALSSMLEHIDSRYAFQHIVLVGGGAPLFIKAVKKQFPHHPIRVVPEPIYANVHGFLLMGQQLAAEKAAVFGASNKPNLTISAHARVEEQRS